MPERKYLKRCPLRGLLTIIQSYSKKLDEVLRIDVFFLHFGRSVLMKLREIHARQPVTVQDRTFHEDR